MVPAIFHRGEAKSYYIIRNMIYTCELHADSFGCQWIQKWEDVYLLICKWGSGGWFSRDFCLVLQPVVRLLQNPLLLSWTWISTIYIYIHINISLFVVLKNIFLNLNSCLGKFNSKPQDQVSPDSLCFTYKIWKLSLA